MSDGITEDHWDLRHEELECQMKKKADKLEAKVGNWGVAYQCN